MDGRCRECGCEMTTAGCGNWRCPSKLPQEPIIVSRACPTGCTGTAEAQADLARLRSEVAARDEQLELRLDQIHNAIIALDIEDSVDTDDPMCLSGPIARLTAALAKCEEERDRLQLNCRERIYIDATPDDELVRRILLAYVDETTCTDNLLGLPPDNPICVVMNKAQEERNAILKEAADRLFPVKG